MVRILPLKRTSMGVTSVRMLEIIWFYHVHYLIYYNRWGCDHPLNSVPGNGTGFPYTEKPRNQTLSSDCEAKVRRNCR